MEFGLIGYPLKHSFSKEIHALISNYSYDICELDESSFNTFITDKKFKGINVTIPYKQKVIPYLDYIDDDAKNINAVNTIINKDGKLYGYNTDILGILDTFSYFDINLNNKNVLILGTGATSNTVFYAVNKLGAKKVLKAYRDNSKIKGDILYSELYKIKDKVDIVINTTSNGMYPHSDDSLLINTKDFINLSAVLDVIYNPLRTRLLLESENIKIKSISGLYMLVSQAYFASKLFTEEYVNNNINLKKVCVSTYNPYLDLMHSKSSFVGTVDCEIVYKKCLASKQNIVLIGMPTCGKSTLGKMISDKYDYNFIDTDKVIEEKINSKIADYINAYGEEKFREIEAETIKEVSSKNHQVISTGGGSILRNENVLNLKSNGKVFFINRSLDKLKPSSDRPLTSDIESLKKKYNERLPIYKKSCDIEINGDIEFDEKIHNILSYM